MRIAPLLLIACVVAAPLGACGQSSSPAKAQADDLIFSPTEDRAREAAEDAAVKSLPVFWSKFHAQPAGYEAYRVKVLLPTDDGRGDEGIWMSVDSISADQSIKGRLSNKPFGLKKLHQGSVIEVDPSRVIDWTYAKGGRAYGHFTTRVLLDRATPEQRAQMLATLAPTPLEPEVH